MQDFKDESVVEAQLYLSFPFHDSVLQLEYLPGGAFYEVKVMRSR